MPTAEEVSRVVAEEAALCLDASLEKLQHCLRQLSAEQLWWRPRESMNSIGNLLLHLTGNARQWLVAGLGQAEDTRQRPEEFAERGPLPLESVLGPLVEAVREAQAALRAADAGSMLQRRAIQGSEVTGWAAVFDSVSHFQGHVQEIICLTRTQLGDSYQFHWQPQTPEQGAEPA